LLRHVEGAPERCLLDQEIIDQELPADVDWNDSGCRLEVGRQHRVAGDLADPGRPGGWQTDAVVQRFACGRTGGLGGEQGASQAGPGGAAEFSAVHGESPVSSFGPPADRGGDYPGPQHYHGRPATDSLRSSIFYHPAPPPFEPCPFLCGTI